MIRCTAAVFLLSVVSACGAKVIPGTKLPDLPVNRTVLAAIDSYKKAMEARDVNALLAMASRDYKEDGGTPTASDDYGREGLERVLKGRLSKVRALRITIDVNRIIVDGNRARVEYRWEIQYQYSHKDKMGWHTKVDDNRFELERVNGQWQFTAGL